MLESPLTPQQQLEALHDRYVQQLPQRVAQLRQTWQELCQTTQPSADDLWEVENLTHRLVGSSATFGLLGVSQTARTLEQLFHHLRQETLAPSSEQQAQIEVLLDVLQQAARPSGGANPWDLRILPDRPKPLNPRLVFLVEDDPDLAQDLALQISCFGYSVQLFKNLDDLPAAIQTNRPAAIVMDVVFPEDGLAGPKLMAEIQAETEPPLPVLFISSRQDLMARLQAVRAGGQAYLSKPINIGELIDVLDELTVSQVPEPYRILIVDDDRMVAQCYALTLEQAGMTTWVVNNPLQVMGPLVEFRPDLILMDMYMPGCTGMELAAVIRQQAAYVGIPIVFLSAETDVNKQLAAIELGGDDFLTKPIQPLHLIASVTPRAGRSRLVRSLMVRDSLTGLLNHTTLKDRLHQEFEKAARTQQPLAFAMIDIDSFKAVNDTYGHLTGDRVLKSLARLLQQRLRKSDITGRYGGEEFAVILPQTDGHTACQVIDRLRNGFSQVRQQTDGAEFSVTFSCGIAACPPYTESSQLNEAADRALYEAKRKGRNQIVLYECS